MALVAFGNSRLCDIAQEVHIVAVVSNAAESGDVIDQAETFDHKRTLGALFDCMVLG